MLIIPTLLVMMGVVFMLGVLFMAVHFLEKSLTVRGLMVMVGAMGMIVVMFLECFSLALNMLDFMAILLPVLGLVVLIFAGFVLGTVSPLPPSPLGRLSTAGQGWWVESSQGNCRLSLPLQGWRSQEGGRPTRRSLIVLIAHYKFICQQQDIDLAGRRAASMASPHRHWPLPPVLRRLRSRRV